MKRRKSFVTPDADFFFSTEPGAFRRSFLGFRKRVTRVAPWPPRHRRDPAVCRAVFAPRGVTSHSGRRSGRHFSGRGRRVGVARACDPRRRTGSAAFARRGGARRRARGRPFGRARGGGSSGAAVWGGLPLSFTSRRGAGAEDVARGEARGVRGGERVRSRRDRGRVLVLGALRGGGRVRRGSSRGRRARVAAPPAASPIRRRGGPGAAPPAVGSWRPRPRRGGARTATRPRRRPRRT